MDALTNKVSPDIIEKAKNASQSKIELKQQLEMRRADSAVYPFEVPREPLERWPLLGARAASRCRRRPAL